MGRRQKLPPRRRTETISFKHTDNLGGVQKFHASIGFYEDGRPGEIFLNSSQKSGTQVDLSVSEAAIAASLALQHGCKIRVLREACLRRSDGSPATPVGALLDALMDNGRPLKREDIV